MTTTQVRQPAAADRVTLPLADSVQWPERSSAAIAALATAGFALFFVSLRGVRLSRMNGLGLISVLPVGAIAGVAILALAFMLGLARPRVHRAVLGAALAGLTICLDGVTTFIEPAPRFATSYQIAGFVEYISSTGHAAPSLAAYFSWPGFFALISLLTGGAGTHGLLTLMRVWPLVIDLLCLPPLFLLMRNLRISWRAQWLAGFLFTVGNWVGQDYFSPQSFNYLLYLVFLAILVNWFNEPGRSASPHVVVTGLSRLHRRIFGIVRPGELGPRPASTGQRAFLLALLIAIFAVSTMSHQLTPFYMVGACTAMALIRRGTLRGLPVLLTVILIGWISFAAVDYWSGHMSNIFGGVGDLGSNLTTSVGGRLAGSTATHLLALHARVGFAAAIVGMAGLGLLRRRLRGFDDRVLLVFLCVPILSIGLQSYGGEIALRIYLFLLPAACVLAACLFFPDPRSAQASRRVQPILAICAVLLPLAFLLVRYGNDAFEQVPQGELAAANWVYAHDARGVRLLWLSSSPTIDNTPEMPWSYQDIRKVDYVPVQAPPDPASVSGLVSALRKAGPGSYLIATRTQETYLEQAVGYRPGWGGQLNKLLTAAPGVRVVFADSTAVIYTLHWPAGAQPQPLPTSAGGPAGHSAIWRIAGLVLLFLLMAVLAAREFMRVCLPASAHLIRPLTMASVPLLALMLDVVILRFAGFS
jgi:hypothetical protein